MCEGIWLSPRMVDSVGKLDDGEQVLLVEKVSLGGGGYAFVTLYMCTCKAQCNRKLKGSKAWFTQEQPEGQGKLRQGTGMMAPQMVPLTCVAPSLHTYC